VRLQKKRAILNGFPGSRLASLRPAYEIAMVKGGGKELSIITVRRLKPEDFCGENNSILRFKNY